MMSMKSKEEEREEIRINSRLHKILTSSTGVYHVETPETIYRHVVGQRFFDNCSKVVTGIGTKLSTLYERNKITISEQLVASTNSLP